MTVGPGHLTLLAIAFFVIKGTASVAAVILVGRRLRRRAREAPTRMAPS